MVIICSMTAKAKWHCAKGNVELIDKETHLYTDTINYDVKNRIARYNDRGRITNADNTLTSIIGIYYVSENLFHFKDSVKIVNPDYVMTADTMDYNTSTETCIFYRSHRIERRQHLSLLRKRMV